MGISDSEGEKLERFADILLVVCLGLLLLVEAPAAVKGEDGLLECQSGDNIRDALSRVKETYEAGSTE